MREVEKPDLTVIIPALKEPENLACLIPQIRSVLEPLSLVLEIIVVDDSRTTRLGLSLLRMMQFYCLHQAGIWISPSGWF